MERLAKCFMFGAVLVLTGCSDWYALSATAIQQKKIYSDAEANAVRNAPCLMTIGAYWRNFSDVERRALDILCGGDILVPPLPTLNPETGLLEIPQ